MLKNEEITFKIVTCHTFTEINIKYDKFTDNEFAIFFPKPSILFRLFFVSQPVVLILLFVQISQLKIEFIQSSQKKRFFFRSFVAVIMIETIHSNGSRAHCSRQLNVEWLDNFIQHWSNRHTETHKVRNLWKNFLCTIFFSVTFFFFLKIFGYCQKKRIQMLFWEWAVTETVIKDCAPKLKPYASSI